MSHNFVQFRVCRLGCRSTLFIFAKKVKIVVPERIEYIEAHALVFFLGPYETFPIIWIGKPAPAIQCYID